jgi:hypothetical protein
MWSALLFPSFAPLHHVHPRSPTSPTFALFITLHSCFYSLTLLQSTALHEAVLKGHTPGHKHCWLLVHSSASP